MLRKKFAKYGIVTFFLLINVILILVIVHSSKVLAGCYDPCAASRAIPAIARLLTPEQCRPICDEPTYQRPPARAQNCEQIRAQMNTIARNAGWGDLGRLKSLEQQYYRCKAGQNRNGAAKAARHRALQAAARRKAEAQRRAADRRQSAIEAAQLQADIAKFLNRPCGKDGLEILTIDGVRTEIICDQKKYNAFNSRKRQRNLKAQKNHKKKIRDERLRKEREKRLAKDAARKQKKLVAQQKAREERKRQANTRRRERLAREAAARRARAERKRQAVLARQRVAERKRKVEVKRQKAVRFKRRQRTTQNNRISAELERRKRNSINSLINKRLAGKGQSDTRKSTTTPHVMPSADYWSTLRKPQLGQVSRPKDKYTIFREKIKKQIIQRDNNSKQRVQAARDRLDGKINPYKTNPPPRDDPYRGIKELTDMYYVENDTSTHLAGLCIKPRGGWGIFRKNCKLQRSCKKVRFLKDDCDSWREVSCQTTCGKAKK